MPDDDDWYEETVTCGVCLGTGHDDAEFDGRCIHCHGEGELRIWRHEEDDDATR